MIFAQRGGLYFSHTNLKIEGKMQKKVISYFAINPDIKISLVCQSILYYDKITYSIIKDYTSWKIGRHLSGENPNEIKRSMIFNGEKIKKQKAITLWDWACVFLYESMSGQNQNCRDQENCLFDHNFMRIAKQLNINEWDGLHYKNINLFSRDANELARNAQYHAARYRVIKIPHLVESDIIKQNKMEIF
jgi:hypothetical protein